MIKNEHTRRGDATTKCRPHDAHASIPPLLLLSLQHPGRPLLGPLQRVDRGDSRIALTEKEIKAASLPSRTPPPST